MAFLSIWPGCSRWPVAGWLGLVFGGFLVRRGDDLLGGGGAAERVDAFSLRPCVACVQAVPPAGCAGDEVGQRDLGAVALMDPQVVKPDADVKVAPRGAAAFLEQ